MNSKAFEGFGEILFFFFLFHFVRNAFFFLSLSFAGLDACMRAHACTRANAILAPRRCGWMVRRRPAVLHVNHRGGFE